MFGQETEELEGGEIVVGKVLPLQMTGANDGPVMIITGVARATD